MFIDHFRNKFFFIIIINTCWVWKFENPGDKFGKNKNQS